MSDTITYIAKDGVRWDTVSQDAYGRPDLFPLIMAANVAVPFTTRIEGGTELKIPVIESTAAQPDASLLPPWKR